MLTGGGDVILIPEHPLTVEDTCEEIEKRHRRGKDFSIVVVSEGYKLTYASGEQREVTQEAALDQFGHVRFGGIGESLAREIESRTGFETRVTVLGHLQRGGTPSAVDRIWATRLGVAATDLLDRGEAGVAPVRRDGDVAIVPLADLVAETRKVPRELYDLTRVFG